MSAPLPPEKIRALLGGYAAGNLTAEEHELLMAAALEDQALFDELMREEPLREALADPLTRAELLEVLPEAHPRVPWWKMSWPYAALASATAAIAIFVVFRPQPQPRLTAEVRPPEAAQVEQKPEPVPSEIAVPRRLTLSTEVKEKGAKLISAQPAAEPKEKEVAATAAAGGVAKEETVRDAAVVGGVQAAREGTAALEKKSIEIRVEQAAAVPLPAAAPPTNVPARADAVAVALETAPGAARQRSLQLAKSSARAGRALEVEVAAMEGDGSWKTAELGAAVPAGRPLRLKVTSPVDGSVEMEPLLAPALRVRGGVPAEWTIPAQARGELRLRLRVRLAEPGTVFRAHDTGQLPAGAAAAPPGNGPGAVPLLVRDIFLKVE